MLHGDISWQGPQLLQDSQCQTPPCASAIDSFIALPGPCCDQPHSNNNSQGAFALQPAQSSLCSPFEAARFSQLCSSNVAASLHSKLSNACAATPNSQFGSQGSASVAAVASSSTEAALQTSSSASQPTSVSSVVQGSSRDQTGAGEMPSEFYSASSQLGSNRPSETQLVAHKSVPHDMDADAFLIPSADLMLHEQIGAGAEGKVYRGTWKYTEVAAKQFLPAAQGSGMDGPPSSRTSDAQAQAALAREVSWLKHLQHPNFVRFCGVCLDAPEAPLVVMEYYKNGSVFSLLSKASEDHRNTSDPAAHQECCRVLSYLTWERRLQMLHDAAAGMCYLHGRCIAHGDLRSPNLFVGTDGKVKIGDFGFAKHLQHDQNGLKITRLTHPRWTAPETMERQLMSYASDVYSFGIVMYEMLTCKIPFFNLRHKAQVVVEVMKGGRPALPPVADLLQELCTSPEPSSSTEYGHIFTGVQAYLGLMRECWAQQPSARPTFDAVAQRLEAILSLSTTEGSGQNGATTLSRSVKLGIDYIIPRDDLELGAPWSVGVDCQECLGVWCGVEVIARQYFDWEYGTAWHTTDDGEVWVNNLGLLERAGWNVLQGTLAKQVAIQAALTHRNVVRFCGVCVYPPLLVTEKGSESIHSLLENARHWMRMDADYFLVTRSHFPLEISEQHLQHLSWERRMRMLHDIASGMTYIHARGFIHGDLRSSNLFVIEESKKKTSSRVVIGNFACAQRLECGQESVKVDNCTQSCWIAPEVLSASEISYASDVYSFGIMMYEMLTFKTPPRSHVVPQELAPILRPQVPAYDELPPNTSLICLSPYIRLMQDCWAQDPQQRPSFSDIARRLKAMQHWFSACSKALSISSARTNLLSRHPVGGVKAPAVPYAVGSLCAPPRQCLQGTQGAAVRPVEPVLQQFLVEVATRKKPKRKWKQSWRRWLCLK